MVQNDVSGFESFGLPGLVIGALFALVYFLTKEHRSERSEWLEAYKEQSEQSDTRQKETNVVIRELTAVIRESNNRRRYSDNERL